MRGKKPWEGEIAICKKIKIEKKKTAKVLLTIKCSKGISSGGKQKRRTLARWGETREKKLQLALEAIIGLQRGMRKTLKDCKFSGCGVSCSSKGERELGVFVKAQRGNARKSSSYHQKISNTLLIGHITLGGAHGTELGAKAEREPIPLQRNRLNHAIISFSSTGVREGQGGSILQPLVGITKKYQRHIWHIGKGRSVTVLRLSNQSESDKFQKSKKGGQSGSNARDLDRGRGKERRTRPEPVWGKKLLRPGGIKIIGRRSGGQIKGHIARKFEQPEMGRVSIYRGNLEGDTRRRTPSEGITKKALDFEAYAKGLSLNFAGRLEKLAYGLSPNCGRKRKGKGGPRGGLQKKISTTEEGEEKEGNQSLSTRGKCACGKEGHRTPVIGLKRSERIRHMLTSVNRRKTLDG